MWLKFHNILKASALIHARYEGNSVIRETGAGNDCCDVNRKVIVNQIHGSNRTNKESTKD
ncbi:MAG: hypothetical protein BWX96_00258 [Bacteroidetes bacterium ADurb.Bin145]|nr:MAG: hypothetical protein BWX96_00258 [Bacteroidetes bacterium ADurb.Bin145]